MFGKSFGNLAHIDLLDRRIWPASAWSDRRERQAQTMNIKSDPVCPV